MDAVSAVRDRLLEAAPRTKSIRDSLVEREDPSNALRKTLTATDLVFLGIGLIIGAGLFVLTGVAAKHHAGPGIIFSFILSGLVCVLSAFCYAEFASRVPVAGSAYTYSYVTYGELAAWMIGWDLTLEYSLGASAVARGWSGYLNLILTQIDVHPPDFLFSIGVEIFGHKVFDIDFLAALVVLFFAVLLMFGIKTG
eukprot:TRINITY_DN11594_c0_g1_i1.p1 TRINITY_DN11594_c0_g1~~TRINITY_DN11594_c0_g1_i1.p1  ORF type:complete len:196 (-),score=29.30 TRINITY_DN11594_c0_g1_i1:269-856(-)